MRLITTIGLLVLAGAIARGQAKTPQPVPDHYNLGPIGGKCSIDGTALVTQKVSADAPGAKAGLKVADRITHISGVECGKEPYRQLGVAIQSVESSDDPTLKLRVTRGTETVELAIAIAPPAKPLAQDIPDAAFRDNLVERALAWLGKQQQSDGSWQNNFSVENGLVVQTSMAGLCFLAAGCTPEKGDHADTIRKAAEFVLEYVGEQKLYKTLQGKNNNQTHWSLGYGAIFLAHVLHHTDAKWLGKSSLKGIKAKLNWIKGRIQSGMEDSGGFGHGPGGPNVLEYIELEAMSNLLLSALGCMKRCGVEPDAKKLDKMLEFARACVDEKGVVGYSTTPPQNGFLSPARSAALANALAALKRNDDPVYPRLMACAKTNAGNAFDGHSTPTMHQLAFAIACKRDGQEGWQAYWKSNRAELTNLRNPDGSFSYRPTAETLMTGRNLDRDLTEVWTTSHWVLILCLDKNGLPLWMGS